MKSFREEDLNEEFKRMLKLAAIPLIEKFDRKNKDRKVDPKLEIDVEEVTGAKELSKLGRGIVEKKKKKKDCKKGNKNHDADGKFSTKGQAASWSGGYEHAEDCYYGKWKYPGGRTKLMTKHKCGKKKDGRKHKYRCKDGSEVYEEQLHDQAFVECMRGYGGINQLIEAIGKEFEVMLEGRHQDKVKAVSNMCRKMGYLTFRDFLMRINWIEKARDGKLLNGKN